MQFPLPTLGTTCPPRPDLSFAGLDESVFQSAVRKTTTSMPETETSISKNSKDIVENPKTVRPSAPIIEEWDTVSMKSINKKSYCLVVTDDFSRFSWVFFLATKDETPKILKNFITGIENQTDHKVKTIRCDNGTEFKNRIMNEFCEMKGIRREFSVARTPQQNGVAERKNRTLIEAARTMLADSK
ncbi:putative ribonuclease H-like domain-containing protein [Tanacetum coccineum]